MPTIKLHLPLGASSTEESWDVPAEEYVVTVERNDGHPCSELEAILALGVLVRRRKEMALEASRRKKARTDDDAIH